jgi:hypothetical protein
MAESKTRGALQVSSNNPAEINWALGTLVQWIDELTGLRGPITLYDTVIAPKYENSSGEVLTGNPVYAFDGALTEGFAFTATGDHPNSGFLAGPGYKITRDTVVAGHYQAAYIWEKRQLEGATLTPEKLYVFTHPWEYAYTGLTQRTLYGLGTVRGET